jgi:hypothetical protein
MGVIVALMVATGTAWFGRTIIGVLLTSAFMLPSAGVEALLLHWRVRPHGRGSRLFLAVGAFANAVVGLFVGFALWANQQIGIPGSLSNIAPGVLVLLIVISAMSSWLMRWTGGSVAAGRPLRAWSTFVTAIGMNVASLIVFVAVEMLLVAVGVEGSL